VSETSVVVPSMSVVIPVKDGERYLEELLDALAREGVDEILVIDSGSRDRSLQIARAAGVEMLEIDPAEFGHGRTRNLGAQRTSGELICFLTQDATPVPGWAAAYREAFALDEHVGAAYGPHLPRPETSPMIARELTEFFASFSVDGQSAVQRPGGQTFLSNVNACYARACWEKIRFREIAYSEDQAFGADMLQDGWIKVYQPSAAVLHAHDYGALEFMRRYFDEYRGLHESTGHVEPFGMLATARQVRAAVAGDRRWAAKQGLTGAEQASLTARSAVHHGGRRVFSALGSRAQRLPAPVRGRLSLEGRDDRAAREPTSTSEDSPSSASDLSPDSAPSVSPVPPTTHMPPKLDRDDYEDVARFWREGAAPLLDPVPGMAERERLRLALVIPSFRRGSGGHNTLLQIFSRLEQRGHLCSVWLYDFTSQHDAEWPAVIRADIRKFFAPIEGPVYKGFADWQGADVAIATGWQTVHPTLMLDQCRARAYIVNDHEPEFYAASTEREMAEDTYRHDLHCIAASPWLRDLLIERYAASADAFQLGVDHSLYQPRPVTRRKDTVIYYARHVTPRRAVPVGLMALSELHRRRPDLRIVLFGDEGKLESPFPYEHLGVLTPPQLATLYSEATVGLCLSLTNFSLMPKEMLACGLPCVELAGVSAESIFGSDGPLELAPLDPRAIADALERLLDDPERWEQRSREGIEFVASHTWEHATDEIEAGLRHALREREKQAA
jgi:glycosyltransferase involved in cell wall biosynthesis/GT2 family glycosyltransferase